MKCSNCNNNEANTHIKRTINGKTQEMFLCSECAHKLGVMDEFDFEPFSMDSFFGNLLGAGAAALNSLAGVDRCGYCGSSLNDIINSGKAGCSNCYIKFEDKLTPSIEKLHGRTKHIGKNVTYTYENDNKDDNHKPSQNSKMSEIDQLKSELKTAIQEQRFEDAAIIRDKIKDLNKED